MYAYPWGMMKVMNAVLILSFIAGNLSKMSKVNVDLVHEVGNIPPRPINNVRAHCLDVMWFNMVANITPPPPCISSTRGTLDM